MPTDGLHTLLAEARAGNDRSRDRAFRELSRLITIFVRAGMGHRLRDHRESVDVSQSIARSFVQDHQAGEIRFESDAAILAYVKTVVRSKLAMLARHDTAQKRGGGAVGLGLDSATGVQATGPGHIPARGIEAHDRLESARDAMSESDREIARLRLSGLDWSQIAEQLGKDPVALRKHWSRLAQRVSEAEGGSQPEQ